jgi:hypothetical protein
MPTKDAAAAYHDCPGTRIQTIDMDQPPGIGISPIPDMDAAHTTVTPRLSANTSAEESQNALSDDACEIVAFAVFIAFSCTVTDAVEREDSDRRRLEGSDKSVVISLRRDRCVAGAKSGACSGVLQEPFMAV